MFGLGILYLSHERWNHAFYEYSSYVEVMKSFPTENYATLCHTKHHPWVKFVYLRNVDQRDCDTQNGKCSVGLSWRKKRSKEMKAWIRLGIVKSIVMFLKHGLWLIV